MNDPILADFLATTAKQARALNADSASVRLVPYPGSGRPPRAYEGIFLGLPHYERQPGGPPRLTSDPVVFRIQFPDDYLRCPASQLLLRVVVLASPVFHPNVLGSSVCLGSAFRTGMPLGPLVESLYRVVGCENFGITSPLDLVARDWFVAHLDEIRALVRPSFRRRRLAARVRVEQVAVPAAGEATELP